MAQPRKPQGAPGGTGGQYDFNNGGGAGVPPTLATDSQSAAALTQPDPGIEAEHTAAFKVFLAQGIGTSEKDWDKADSMVTKDWKSNPGSSFKMWKDYLGTGSPEDMWHFQDVCDNEPVQRAMLLATQELKMEQEGHGFRGVKKKQFAAENNEVKDWLAKDRPTTAEGKYLHNQIADISAKADTALGAGKAKTKAKRQSSLAAAKPAAQYMQSALGKDGKLMPSDKRDAGEKAILEAAKSGQGRAAIVYSLTHPGAGKETTNGMGSYTPARQKRDLAKADPERLYEGARLIDSARADNEGNNLDAEKLEARLYLASARGMIKDKDVDAYGTAMNALDTYDDMARRTGKDFPDRGLAEDLIDEAQNKHLSSFYG